MKTEKLAAYALLATTALLKQWLTTKITVSTVCEARKPISNRVFVNKCVHLSTIGANLSNISRPKPSSTDLIEKQLALEN
ncbi:hypothetical protein O9929_01105 [Vibrio lentus]|nr:hypothetical protein [Vibrio lentus]